MTRRRTSVFALLLVVLGALLAFAVTGCSQQEEKAEKDYYTGPFKGKGKSVGDETGPGKGGQAAAPQTGASGGQ